MSSVPDAPATTKRQPVDILVLTALPEECRVIRDLESDWIECSDASGLPYYIRQQSADDGHVVTYALASAERMAGEAAINRGAALLK